MKHELQGPGPLRTLEGWGKFPLFPLLLVRSVLKPPHPSPAFGRLSGQWPRLSEREIQILGPKSHIQWAYMAPQLRAPDPPLLLLDASKQGWAVLVWGVARGWSRPSRG